VRGCQCLGRVLLCLDPFNFAGTMTARERRVISLKNLCSLECHNAKFFGSLIFLFPSTSSVGVIINTYNFKWGLHYGGLLRVIHVSSTTDGFPSVPGSLENPHWVLPFFPTNCDPCTRWAGVVGWMLHETFLIQKYVRLDSPYMSILIGLRLD
jgi:hypothetical protein